MKFLNFLFPVLMVMGCTSGKQVYESNCNEEQAFKKISYSHLIDSLSQYDQQYIEIVGRYVEGKQLSVLYNDSTLLNNNNTALWINFSQDCPLYLSGTQKGFFDYTNGEFSQFKNKKVRIRGKVDTHNHGPLKHYRACIDRVSLIEM